MPPSARDGSAASADSGASTFVDPIIANGADPSVVFVDGVYYSVQSGCAHTGTLPVICMRAAATLPALGQTKPVVVWSAPASGPNAQELWAPQIANFDGHWYIYYAADADGTNAHRLFALVPASETAPLGTWVAAATGASHGQLVTDWASDWAIDPDVFLASDGRYYLVYSCRQDNSGTNAGNAQSICLSAMSDPLHLQADPQTGHAVVQLSKPTQHWETRAFPTQEGPFGFTHDGVDYILFSASYSGIPDLYAEGVLINEHPPQPNGAGNPLTNPADWIKQGPLLDGHNAAYGTASSVLVPSPDGSELWNVYHGTDCLSGCSEPNGNSWPDRSLRAQKAGWSASGALVMGYPVDIANTDGTGENVALQMPSANGGGTVNLPAWGSAFGDAAEGDDPDGLVVGDWLPLGTSGVANTNLAPGRLNQSFFGANPNWNNYILYTKVTWIAS
ncbi:MAG TPA: family 43 glycosylhydrolase, partial [Polyangia bacterium]|nr:family 43 glycosylhydrolase [Polyangia bacterium]